MQLSVGGDNDQGQLGLNPTVKLSSKIPVIVEDGSGNLLNPSKISAGGDNTCAIVGTPGSIKCWGANRYGLLGNDTGHDGFVPQAIPLLVTVGAIDATSVSVGNEFACAVVNGGVQCWGDNQNGQLGFNHVVPDSNPAVPLESSSEPLEAFDPGPGVTELSVGRDFACASLPASGDAPGSVLCWGADSDGQLGNGDGLSTSVSAIEETPVFLAAGGSSACAVLATTIKCWGANIAGELGNGDVIYKDSPVLSQTIPGLIALEAGDGFSCALIDDGTVKCWGDYYRGKTGYGVSGDSAAIVDVIGISGAAKISLGSDHACAIVELGEVMCWGSGSQGRLGDGSSASTRTQVAKVSGIGDADLKAVAISAGDAHTCAVLEDGTVKCWGSNSDGQLGDGSTTNSNVPVFVNASLGVNLLGAYEVSAGSKHTCAAYDDGYTLGLVTCWGLNYSGQLGNDTFDDSPYPSSTVNTTDNAGNNSGSDVSYANSLSAGHSHTCVEVNYRGVQCWGSGTDGELGNGFSFDKDNAVAIRSSVAYYAKAGKHFTCGDTDQGIHCWGLNETGQLGSGSINSANFPTPVIGMGSTTEDTLLAVGVSHACASQGDAVKCWGSNSGFALGVGATRESSVPVEVSGVLRAASLTLDNDVVQNGGQQSAAVDPATMLKPELAKANRISVLKTGQRITLTGTNLSNVKSVMVGSKDAKILSSSGSEIVIEVPANLFGSPQVTLVSSSGIQTVGGVMQIVKPYLARSVKVSSFKGNSITKAAALSIRKSYLRDSSVNTVVCAAVIGKGTSARVKAATIAKSVSACSAVSGYSVKFSEFKIAVRTLKTPLKTPYVTVTLSRSTPSLVN